MGAVSLSASITVRVGGGGRGGEGRVAEGFGNYRGLKLIEQVMKVLKRIVDGLSRQLVSIDDSQFGFVPGRGTTDAIFAVRQLQEKYLAANKRLHGFRRPGEGVWLSTSEGHLVGAEKTWCGGVDCATGAGDVCKCTEPCPCWWGVQWRVWSEGWCSPRISSQPTALHHCAWSLVTRVPLWGPLGGPLCRWPCYHRWIAWGMCQEALHLERSNGEESKWRVNAIKTKIMHLWYGPGPPAEFRRVSMFRLSHWSEKQQHLLQRLQALGAQEMQWAQALDKGPWLQMYTVPGNCTPLGRQTTEGSPSWTWQAGAGSFLLLPRRHTLSSPWLWTFNHNMCENRLEVQGAATSSLFPPPLFLQGQAARYCHHQIQRVTWHWGSGPHSKEEKAPLVWACGTLQWCRQDNLWHTGWWKAWAWEAQDDMETADREGLQRVEALGYRPSW